MIDSYYHIFLTSCCVLLWVQIWKLHVDEQFERHNAKFGSMLRLKAYLKEVPESWAKKIYRWGLFLLIILVGMFRTYTLT